MCEVGTKRKGNPYLLCKIKQNTSINMNMNINLKTNPHQHHRPKSGFSSARDLIAKNKLLQRDPALGELRARRNTMCEKNKNKNKNNKCKARLIA